MFHYTKIFIKKCACDDQSIYSKLSFKLHSKLSFKLHCLKFNIMHFVWYKGSNNGSIIKRQNAKESIKTTIILFIRTKCDPTWHEIENLLANGVLLLSFYIHVINISFMCYLISLVPWYQKGARLHIFDDSLSFHPPWLCYFHTSLCDWSINICLLPVV